MIQVRVHPANMLNANQRLHWANRARRTRVLRELGCMAARVAGVPRMQAARIIVTIHPPDRRKRDLAQNPAPTIKALIDGIVDAKILPGDDDQHVLSQTTQPGPVTVPGLWVFDIELWEAIA